MNDKIIFALGVFDGVHLGHQALLTAAAALGKAQGARAGAVTFSAHPDSLVLHGAPGLINTIEDRVALLRRFGMDTVVVLPFDDAMRQLSWEDFLLLLMQTQGAAGFVCGEDFHFGFRGQGNAGKLGDFCQARGLPFAIVPEQTLEGSRVSSTLIRGFLEQGDLDRANRFLGHRHILTGPVIRGHQLGRRLGIPTANLALPEELAVPRFGVYACRCQVEGEWYPAVTNIGVRPTVSGEGITVEPWILDYSGDLYGREITLEFYAFLRPERKFPDLEALKTEIHHNAQQTRALLEKNL